MAVSISRKFVEQILLGRFDNRRQLQDSPILTDVWIAYAKSPDKQVELLITPSKQVPAGRLAFEIDLRIQREPSDGANIASLQGVVAASLYFDELLRIVLPMTEWWDSERVKKQFKRFELDQGVAPRGNAPIDRDILVQDVAERLNMAINFIVEIGRHSDQSQSFEMLPSVDRLNALAGLILWARHQTAHEGSSDPLAEALDRVSPESIYDFLYGLFQEIRGGSVKSDTGHPAPRNLVKLVSCNRTATAAILRSVPTTKADAARGLFKVDCSEITWAIIDSGIQGDHPAFRGHKTRSRILASFDFTNIRNVVNLDNLRILDRNFSDKQAQDKKLKDLLHADLLQKLSDKQAKSYLRELADNAKNLRAVNWDLVRPFVEIKPTTRPTASDHGTHVAGILGASGAKENLKDLSQDVINEYVNGMCPEIQLYDFRVLAPSLKETEFAIIAALQFIRHLNARTDHMVINGANLSLSIPHDVRNYGCGRTPICLECDRMVDDGVVVVAAAGNLGYHTYTTDEGSYEGYAAFSITDPGNADGVITVGSTHRLSPHTNGVSFFSSRGPTGDGRLKPDLVAPGERIRAPFREDWDDLDGTSMAAPHVSGAAAMLMARYPELIGRPRRIKKILCDSASDLGRERSFQGHGMLDVLRALQSI
jgi:serine protease AprX